MVDIIIVRFNALEYEQDCVRSVLHFTTNCKITVYDNYTQKENIAQLWNRLIRQSECEYVCLLNSDTVVSRGWLEGLLEVFNYEENVGAVGPSTSSSRNPQAIGNKENWQKPELVDFEQEYGKTHQLSGFCLLVSKKAWKDAGGFPEDLGFYGQENVFLNRVQKKGYKTIWRKSVFVYHYGSVSAKKEFTEIQLKEERKKANIFYQKEINDNFNL